MSEKPVYIGTSPSYENAANKTDVPRYSDEEKDEFARFASTPEPELVYESDKKKAEEEDKPKPEGESKKEEAPKGGPEITQPSTGR
ncbi:hypothetical protein SEA_AUSTIN_20 [Gordonia phage Austin]|nr:hypothetical protein SEA_AUSTIN_20 [Gordonia phage Austin]